MKTAHRILFAATLLIPLAASAHQHETYRIGGKTYDITIGSLNEPVAVDDKSGVDLTVTLAAGAHGHDATGAAHEEQAATPVLGLEKTLKVELQAAGKTKELPLTTQYGKPGSYKAVFIPTVATTITYRVFGTIDGTQVDLSFTCNPAGHPATPEDTTEQAMGPNVTRVSKSGSFGCPAAKAELGFPEPAATLVDLRDGGESSDAGKAGIGLSVAALAMSFVALARRRAA
jgi:hypothetical protein